MNSFTHVPSAERVKPGSAWRVEKQEHLSQLRHAIDHASHYLPSQGPITVFIHHNTLHAFEELPFLDGVEQASERYGCEPYLREEYFRDQLRIGRIRLHDLDVTLREELGPRAEELHVLRGSRFDLARSMLLHPFLGAPSEELRWFIFETNALRRIRPDVSAMIRDRLISETRRWVMRDLRGQVHVHDTNDPNREPTPGRRANRELLRLIENFGEARIEHWSNEEWESYTLQALWSVCGRGASVVEAIAPQSHPTMRYRDLLLQITGEDSDLLVDAVLIPLCAAFVDQGFARWPIPERGRGFYQSFCDLYSLSSGPPDAWRRNLALDVRRLIAHQISPLESILESLEQLGIARHEWNDYLSATLLALKGWGGMLQQLAERPDRAVHPIPSDSLVDFLAVRLVLERHALTQVAQATLGTSQPLSELRSELHRLLPRRNSTGIEKRSFQIFQLAQVMGWTPAELDRLSEREWRSLFEEIESFASLQRRRIFHLAYERRFYVQFLDALVLHDPSKISASGRPDFQVTFCIDEREESFRRHLEEVAGNVETFGIAGFYFLASYYRGVDDAHFVPLCPVVVRPRHWIVERVVQPLEETQDRRSQTRRALGKATHQLHVGSRSFALGAIVSALLGVLASIPLVARTLFPRLTARIRNRFGRILLNPPQTRLTLERDAANEPGVENGHRGFTIDELTDAAERVLRDLGLVHGFARLVLTLGHGSSSLNNPHASAYECGACGGSKGGPNGRAIAQALNHPLVRQQLRSRGIVIPDDTVFVGGMHNTCNETVTYYDLDDLPQSHLNEMARIHDLIEQALARNAHERCRRFQSAPLTISFEEARKHVEARSEDPAQVRPELGHATNAICIVGRRSRTRGLFLDRRAFLNSYDPTQDDTEGTILTRILQAAMPVCAGISLEYYFSRVDNVGYGCGNKLPHNVTSLLGVMEGAASDLRTGLPWQMVEIHEPIRILFVIETTPETMLRILKRDATLDRLVRNEWVHLALIDPNSNKVVTYRGGTFHGYCPEAEHLPRASSSLDWYRGWRDHLEFAAIARGN